MSADVRRTVALVASVLLALACFVWFIRLRSGSSVHIIAILLALSAIGSSVVAALGVGPKRFTATLASAMGRTLTVGQMAGLVLFLSTAALVARPSGGVAVGLFVGTSGVAAASVVWNMRSRRVGSFALAVVALGAVLLLVLGGTSTDDPTIDVIIFQQDGSRALLDGQNPYALRFPNPYNPEDSARFYDPELIEDGQLQFGFPYPPASLVAVAPFEIVLGDFRVAHVLAMIATALVIAAIRPDSVGRATGILWLLVAPVPYVAANGWTEPLVALAASGSVLAASRSMRAAPFVVGCAVALKQYMVLVLPTSLLLVARPWTFARAARVVVPAVAVVAIATLPFLAWGPGDYVFSTIGVQLMQPFRDDSLALPALYAHAVAVPAESVVTALQVAGAGFVLVLSLRRSPTGPLGFALASAAVLGVFFLLSKQAFPNYYLVVIALLLAGFVAPDETIEDRHAHAVDLDESGQVR